MELLVTIAVLAMIVTIAYPIVTGVLQDSKEKAYRVQIKNIEKASYDWIKMFPSSLPDTEGSSISISLLHLKKAGLIDVDLKNPITKKYFPDDMVITITYTKNKYVALVDDKSGTSMQSDASYQGMIVLNGEARLTTEINDTSFVDPGATGYDENGHTISSSRIVATVRKDGTIFPEVDITKLGLYEITYEVSINGKKVSAKRTVEVVDTVPPIITVPTNTTISSTTSSLDLMEGVSATDNSLESISVTASGNVTLKVPGEYEIRYTAEDSSGNTREKKRIITVS